ncbi:MAG: NfeD family protein [Bacilli bacterium]|mgnify:CR=1 FL=1|jgi:membrane protein implicated in regulation of membrane protease activity|nr:NfeD family protein [Acholeplasmataceae bacterium]
MLLILKSLGPIDWFMVAAWGIIFVVTLIIELETADLVTIWFSLSALITLICGVIFLKPLYQILLFLVLSVVLILATKPLAKKRMRGTYVRTNTDRFIGMVAVVTKEILPNEIGEVKIDNQLWRAVNNEGLAFQPGEKVIVDAISGIKLVVSKIDGNVELLKK